jgi:hypothetical protein
MCFLLPSLCLSMNLTFALIRILNQYFLNI